MKLQNIHPTLLFESITPGSLHYIVPSNKTKIDFPQDVLKYVQSKGIDLNVFQAIVKGQTKYVVNAINLATKKNTQDSGLTSHEPLKSFNAVPIPLMLKDTFRSSLLITGLMKGVIDEDSKPGIHQIVISVMTVDPISLEIPYEICKDVDTFTTTVKKNPSVLWDKQSAGYGEVYYKLYEKPFGKVSDKTMENHSSDDYGYVYIPQLINPSNATKLMAKLILSEI